MFNFSIIHTSFQVHNCFYKNHKDNATILQKKTWGLNLRFNESKTVFLTIMPCSFRWRTSDLPTSMNFNPRQLISNNFNPFITILTNFYLSLKKIQSTSTYFNSFQPTSTKNTHFNLFRSISINFNRLYLFTNSYFPTKKALY